MSAPIDALASAADGDRPRSVIKARNAVRAGSHVRRGLDAILSA